MRGGHGDHNSEKHLKNILGCKTKQKIPFKNKMQNFRVILTCDRRYDTFDMQKKKKHYIENLIFQNFQKLKKS